MDRKTITDNLAPIQRAMVDAGYCVSVNNIHGLPGVIMYAAGPGVPEFPKHLEVQVTNDRIRVFSSKLVGESYSRNTYWDTITEHVFSDVQAFLSAAPCISEPGQPAYSCGWD